MVGAAHIINGVLVSADLQQKLNHLRIATASSTNKRRCTLLRLIGSLAKSTHAWLDGNTRRFVSQHSMHSRALHAPAWHWPRSGRSAAVEKLLVARLARWHRAEAGVGRVQWCLHCPWSQGLHHARAAAPRPRRGHSRRHTTAPSSYPGAQVQAAASQQCSVAMLSQPRAAGNAGPSLPHRRLAAVKTALATMQLT